MANTIYGNRDPLYFGQTPKYHLDITAGDFEMYDYDFTVRLQRGPNSIVIPKSQMIVDNEVSLTSANAVENRIIRQNFLYALLRSTTVLKNTRIADNGQTSSSNYLDVVRIEVVPGNTYSVWTHMNVTSGLSSFFMFVWTDSNGAGVKAEEYYEVGSGHKYWYNHFMIAPEGAAYLNVNVWDGYLDTFLCQRLCTSSYIRKEQVQSNWNETDSNSLKYIANKPSIPDSLSDLSEDSTHRVVTDTEKSTWNGKQNAITISSSEPTSSQGSNGDIWIVV